MRGKFTDPPPVPPGGIFRNPDPRGCLASIAHSVLSWTLATKEDMMSNDKEYDREVYEKVLRGIRGNNPAHKEATSKEKAQAAKVVKAQGKHLKAKYNNKHKGGDYTIDSGMFDS